MSFSEGTFTLSSVIAEVLDAVHGFVRDQDQTTSLAAGIDADDLTFTVSDATQVSRGLVEIEDELVYVSGVDPTTGVATVPTWGRAQSGTTAAAHSSGAKVTNAPLYPRQRVASTVFGILREVFPDVFPVGESFLDVSAAVTNYELPVDCYHVLAVEWHLPGPTGMWLPAKRWRQNKTATAVELELLSPVWPGTDNTRVRYIRTPPTTLQSTDDLASYGYDNQIRDVVVLGATARLMAFTDTARVQAQSVEAHGRSEAVPAGSAVQLSRYLFQLFQKRVEDERKQIILRHPIQPHLTR